MRQIIILGAGLASFCVGLSGPLFAADPPVTPGSATPGIITPAAGCLNDLRAFHTQMLSDGYWLGGSGYGYGYPAWGFPSEEVLVPRPASNVGTSHSSARAGYEIRVLVAAANVEAQNGLQQTCEATLGTARTLYAQYAARLHDAAFARADSPAWQRQQIASAMPVAGGGVSYRADQLIDTDVRDTANQPLGSVHDLIMNPVTGRIDYLVVARGGLFGIGESFVPVPWQSFRAASNLSLLVLDVSKAAFDGAPRVRRNLLGEAGQSTPTGEIDAYWRAHPVTPTPGR